jgi:hypothetical protein
LNDIVFFILYINIKLIKILFFIIINYYHRKNNDPINYFLHKISIKMSKIIAPDNENKKTQNTRKIGRINFIKNENFYGFIKTQDNEDFHFSFSGIY